MKNDLINFLNRIPWAEKKLLEQYFGNDRLSLLLQKSSGKIESIMSADGRTYYSCSPANYRLLPGVYRREMVRKYAEERFGYSIFDSAESPCFNTDFRFFDSERNIWIRIWGDMGSVSPECLLIFRNPPVTGEGLLDLILTCQGSERASFLEVQTELAWKPVMAGCVEIVEAESGLTRTIMPEPAAKISGHAYTPEEEQYPGLSSGQITGFNDTKKRKITIQEIRSTELCALSSKLTPNDYALMRFIACNPFLNEKEIGLLFGGDSCPADSYFRTAHEHDVIQDTRSRVDELRKMDLLKRISKGVMSDTYIPTWKSIDLLAAYHGTIPLYMNKYSQWPEKLFTKNDFENQRQLLPDKHPFFDSHCHYRQRWAEVRPEHQVLLQEFCAALLCGARSLKSMRRVNVEVSGVTTISSNLKIAAIKNGKQIIRQLHPDGCCDIVYKGQSCKTKRWKVFFEIERNTNTRKTLLQKMEKYRKFLPAAKLFYRDFDDIALIFFFDDTGNNPGAVLEKTELLIEVMKRNRITGYIGLLSDAKRVPGGWLQKHGKIERKTCGEMVLYQKIWRSSASDDPHRMHTLLDIPAG